MPHHPANMLQLPHRLASVPLSLTGTTDIDIDEMATQTLVYMDTLEDHASVVHCHPQRTSVYQQILDQGQALPPQSKFPSLDNEGQKRLRKRMEDIIQRPASTIEDHLQICFAANTLLLLQHNILSHLPFPKSREIEGRINKLRAEQRRMKYPGKAVQFHPLVPRPPLMFERPRFEASQCRITKDSAHSLLNFPSLPKIIGQQFCLRPADIFYHVHAIKASLEGYQFAIQYENIRDPDRLTSLSMDLAAAFYDPTIFLPDLHLLRHIERLHLMNGWVARCGLYISLQELRQLTHLSFHIHPPGQAAMHAEILSKILEDFTRLQVIILWRVEYQKCEEVYSNLEQHSLADHRIVVFNTAHFAEYAWPVNSFWKLAESIVQWQGDNQELFNVPGGMSSLNLLL
ncbi:hypothetical protein BKA82DRAFT_21480 [Pisolithus tinctorius]|uniref:Uncharacterized protein n=1 Tax=Pisolithus tinctorius Marx 270 TaxID=870435 RepID=A0A0C3PQ01_PISTI|nr:hypothetical protein BKA82DRAFT_21480 [Pisolithus tinctorius]KIO10574.1 hypothetical protein M404DRAFT_21480 [Pisolithus tinctorius Marx 270]